MLYEFCFDMCDLDSMLKGLTTVMIFVTIMLCFVWHGLLYALFNLIWFIVCFPVCKGLPVIFTICICCMQYYVFSVVLL